MKLGACCAAGGVIVMGFAWLNHLRPPSEQSHLGRFVGQVLTDLNAPGGDDGSGDYSKLPKGNLDVTGRYFIWTTNVGGDRLDAFLVKIPAERLGGS